MPELHICVQQDQIKDLVASDKKQSAALFGDDFTGEVGIVADVKAMRALLEEMKPTYKELNDWGTFFQKGKKLGLALASVITIVGILYGGMLAIKTWLQTPIK